MTYIECTDCDGEFPFDVEDTDDGAADLYGPSSYYQCWLDRGMNRASHREECPGLHPADERIDALEDEASRLANDPAYGYRATRAEAWAEVGL